MERSILAPLSPNEELALRRVAGGRSGSVRADQTVLRLKTLKLVEEIDGKLRLTSLGRSRYTTLPNASAPQDSDQPKTPTRS